MRTELPAGHRDTVAAALADSGNTPLSIAVLSSYTANNLKEPLAYSLACAGFAPRISFGGYQQYNQELRDSASALYKEKPSVIVLALSSRSLFPELPFAPGTEAYAQVRDACLQQIDLLLDSVAASSTGATILLTTLEPVRFSPYGFRDALAGDGAQAVIDACNGRIREAARTDSRIALLDFAAFVSRFGQEHLTDDKLWYAGKVLLTNKAAIAFAEEVAGIIGALYGRTKKCIAVDLDNTLWGGVVGEDGVEGIVTDEESTLGKVYRDIQRTLLAYRGTGILLAAVSKNDEAEALAALRHKDLLLHADDFAAVRINWSPKSENLRAIAEELNIGLDSILFVDDNPAERLEVAANLPQVEVLDMPADIAKLPALLQTARSLHRYTFTEEDAKRHELYAQDRKRVESKTAGAAVSGEDYLRSLKTEIEVRANDLGSLGRVTQLINKTNQFNLRTKRYSEEQVRSFMTDGKHLVASVRVWDAFGELGLTGVLIFERREKSFFIDTFLLSCRILSRGIEQQFFTEAVRLLAAEHAGAAHLTLEAEYLPTPKNALAKEVYKALGFDQTGSASEGGSQRYRAVLDVPALPVVPYIRVRP